MIGVGIDFALKIAHQVSVRRNISETVIELWWLSLSPKITPLSLIFPKHTNVNSAMNDNWRPKLSWVLDPSRIATNIAQENFKKSPIFLFALRSIIYIMCTWWHWWQICRIQSTRDYIFTFIYKKSSAWKAMSSSTATSWFDDDNSSGLSKSFQIRFFYWYGYHLAGFEISKYKSKKCIQFDDGSIRYSLKVINGTDVIFEVSLDCLYKRKAEPM